MENFSIQELQASTLTTLSNNVGKLERQLQELKLLEKELKSEKQKLYEAMTLYDVKSWEAEGVKITRVAETEDKVEVQQVFDEEEFKKENPEIYEAYLVNKKILKSGRAGYVRITIKEGKNE